VIQSNVFITSLKNIPLFFKNAATISSLPTNQQYRPMVATTLAIDYWLANGLNPFWFHVTTFCWYLFQCFLMYYLFLKIANIAFQHRLNSYFSLIAVAIYGVHTANAETINYICARSDALSTCWFVLALIVYIYFQHYRRWGLHLLPLIIAALFKQTAVVFPAILFVYVLYFEQQAGIVDLFQRKTAAHLWRNLSKTTGSSWITALLLCIFLKKMDPSSYIPGGSSVYHYLITQPFVALHYFLTFFLPLQLSADTDWAVLNSIHDDRFFIGIFFLISLLSTAVFTSKKPQLRPISFGIFWFFITLLPTSSIIPLAEVMNDHRIFFPFIGLTLAVSYAAYYFFMHRPKIQAIFFVLFSLIIAGHAYGTYQRNQVWLSEESLWHDVTIKSPKNGRGLMNYGLTQMGQGKYIAAEHYFLEALKYTPTYATLHINLGILYHALEKKDAAEFHFQQAMKFNYNNEPNIFNFYAKFKMKHDPKTAEELLLKSLALSPGNTDTQYLLMELYHQQEAFEKLQKLTENALIYAPHDTKIQEYHQIALLKKDKIKIMLEAIAENPSASYYLTLSLLYFEKHDYPEVISACKNAIKLQPRYAEAYNNLCAAYNELKNYDQAELACKKALKINPDFQLAKNNLATSQAGKDHE
jgi:Flp pilus assembly protein TadD